MKVGVTQGGIRLNASCSPFDVVPPELYARFKKACLEQAKVWGLSIHFGQDDGSIAQAEQRFWQQQRAHVARQRGVGRKRAQHAAPQGEGEQDNGDDLAARGNGAGVHTRRLGTTRLAPWNR